MQQDNEPQNASARVQREEASSHEAKRLSREADQLQASLDEVARAHGYLSYAQMQQRITADLESLDKKSRTNLLKKLLPLSASPAKAASGVALPPADLTGLTPVPDMARSLARLIRVLLLGYTEEELDELSDRIKAVRGQRVEASASDRDERHHRVIEWIDHAASPSAPKVAP